MEDTPEIKSAKEVLAASDAKSYLSAPSYAEFIVSQAKVLALIAIAKEFSRLNNLLETQEGLTNEKSN